MVDVSAKTRAHRVAVAAGRVLMGETAFRALADGDVAKGDVLTVAQVAGIAAAKRTATLIPLCHHVAVTALDVELSLDQPDRAVDIRATATAHEATGVEMEALVAMSVTALAIYDMCKSLSKSIRISDVQLLHKTGGKGGEYHAASANH